MGCFLGCFGFKKRKYTKRPANKCPSEEQNPGSYVPLDSNVPNEVDTKEIINVSSNSYHLKEKPKEPTKSKIKKKVTFNLNVKAYEPIPKEDDAIDYLSEGEEETKWEFNEVQLKSFASLQYGEDYSNSVTENYRYQNCTDSYDDEELTLGEKDLYSDEFEDSEHESDDVSSEESDDGIESQENFDWELNPLDSCSVLNPVENLAQWKKVKGKAKNGLMKFQKENLNPKQDEEKFLGTRPNPDSLNFIKKMGGLNAARFSERTISVDASFSGWNM
ncbi:(Dimethylallyl)adenosine tRNAmethylthiotransferase MiaB [Striga asiatica]|uniref:(Dimethylallyl)adenosine tRNAmethylthiotransferase MiaB n=1 Tax=Striga asiatica TaxID=4170 RepID=A0A5A7R479_STRAF|nr:(Dimethylallyl)adenosine tRNAmethylthiotransferase MiaB [Striga asiatica]